jgi:hypothetical protein
MGSPQSMTLRGAPHPRRSGSAVDSRRPADRRERARVKPACRAADWRRAIVGPRVPVPALPRAICCRRRHGRAEAASSGLPRLALDQRCRGGIRPLCNASAPAAILCCPRGLRRSGRGACRLRAFRFRGALRGCRAGGCITHLVHKSRAMCLYATILTPRRKAPRCRERGEAAAGVSPRWRAGVRHLRVIVTGASRRAFDQGVGQGGDAAHKS